MKLQNAIRFEGKASYVISVEGKISEFLSQQLEPLNMEEVADGDHVITKLTFMIKDQTELAGVLNNLYEKHLVIVSMEAINKNDKNKKKEN